MLPRADRYRVAFKIVWDDGESFNAGPVVNISETGVFVETTMPAPVGQEVTLVPLVEGKASIYELRGTVVRAAALDEDARDKQSGMGVVFSLKPEELIELKRFLEEFRI